MKTILTVALFFCMAPLWPLAAQAPSFDTSGNGKLSGTYYFRHVYYNIDFSSDSNGIIGDVTNAVALFGNIAFDGNGNYSITNGFVSDSNAGVTADPLSCYINGQTCAANGGSAIAGTYSVSASGYGFLVDAITGDSVYGLVAASGIFSGSSTEGEVKGGYGDLLIAAPLPSPLPTAFKGSYTVVGYEPGEDMSFQINPAGAGSLGTVAINGYYEGGGTTTISQSSNVTYTFSNGAAVLNFPTSTTANFFSGPEYLYFSPDGNFFFGGSPYGYDMIVGLATTSGTQNFGTCNAGASCLYYQAGLDQNTSQINTGYADFDAYFGSFNATSTGTILAHQRLADQVFFGSAYGFTYSDPFTPPVTGGYTDNSYPFQFWVGDGGAIRIGQGIGPYLALNVAFQAPTFTATSPVYINPTGIVNAASFAPFTAGVTNGEFITIFGTNLAPGTQIASTVPYQTLLNGVQVFINHVAAPIYYVSSGQIAVIVPAQDPYSLAQIQVVNNGVSSNVVTEPLYPAAPGIYTTASAGVYAAAVDANLGQIVTPETPAQPGDIVEVYMTGLGIVSPPVPDGAAPPDSPLSYTFETISADVDGVTANPPTAYSFAGLAPTLAGLYQVNVQIPSTTTAGDHYLDIQASNPSTLAVDAYTEQVLISVGGGAAARPAETPLNRSGRKRPANMPNIERKRPCFYGARTAACAR